MTGNSLSATSSTPVSVCKRWNRHTMTGQALTRAASMPVLVVVRAKAAVLYRRPHPPSSLSSSHGGICSSSSGTFIYYRAHVSHIQTVVGAQLCVLLITSYGKHPAFLPPSTSLSLSLSLSLSHTHTHTHTHTSSLPSSLPISLVLFPVSYIPTIRLPIGSYGWDY